MRFTDKVCLVTGAASGIGKATVSRMAAEGGIVFVRDRRYSGQFRRSKSREARKYYSIAII